MPRKPDTPCSRCGTLMWSGTSSLPAETRVCHPCRRLQPAPYGIATPLLISCTVCGESSEVPRRGTARRRKTCSIECLSVLRGSRGRSLRTCEICAESYRPTYAAQRTCGRVCGAELNRTVWPTSRVYFGTCPACDTVFAAKTSARVYCRSYECFLKRSFARYTALQDAKPVITKDCPECGANFVSYDPHRQGMPRVYCSKRCTRRALARTRRHRLRAAGPADSFTLRQIAIRDGWRCHLCGRRVVSMKQASIDHLVPVSAGGSHTLENVALAHHLCNSRRGARGAVQLLLVG